MYVHKKKTNGEVFYVGKGSGDRAWSKAGRNELWVRTTKKHGFTVEIVLDNLQEWYAFELEKDLISLHGRVSNGTGKLVNMTDGGEGLSGADHPYYDPRIWTFVNIHTDEHIRTTKYSFNRTHPYVHTGGLFYGQASCHGWCVRELLTDYQFMAVKSKFTGEYSITGDKTRYDFVWLKTGECFNKTRFEMSKIASDINTSSLILGTLKTSKGWAMKKVFDEYGAEYLLNYNAGEQNGRADCSEYEFKNMITGEIFKGTRFAFQTAKGFNPRDLFTTRINYIIKDWCLLENYAIAKEMSQADYGVYTFVHKDGRTFIGTRKEFRKEFGHNVKPLFGKNRFKNCKGWSLAQENLQ